MLQGPWGSRLSLFAAGRKGTQPGTVGVHVGEKRLAAVRLCATSPLPTLELLRHSSVDSGGPTSTIRALAQEGFFASARVFVTLPGGKYDTITIAAPPAVPEEELRDALRWQMRGALSYPPEEAAFDFVRLPQASREETASASAPAILIVAARRRDVAQALAPFQAAGVEVNAIDIPEMAQRNLLGGGVEPDVCQGFLSFDDSSALLTVQLADELCFARRMQLPGVGRPEEDEPEHTADRIATNVQRSLEVFARQSQMPEVVSVVIGTHPHASLIARAISEQAAVPTTLFDAATAVALEQNVRTELDGVTPRAPEMLLALGTALRSDEGIRSIANSALSLPAWLLPGKKAA